MVTELKIDAIPNGNIPTIIMVHNKRWSFCTGFIKGLKKFFMTFWVQIEQTLYFFVCSNIVVLCALDVICVRGCDILQNKVIF